MFLDIVICYDNLCVNANCVIYIYIFFFIYRWRKLRKFHCEITVTPPVSSTRLLYMYNTSDCEIWKLFYYIIIATLQTDLKNTNIKSKYNLFLLERAHAPITFITYTFIVICISIVNRIIKKYLKNTTQIF